jgi:predicted MFS family arabinose efflux permease
MHRVLALVCAVIFLDVGLFAALGPLLPDLEQDLGISSSQSGFLVASYPLGYVLAAFPAARLSIRLGVKRTTAGGLATLAAMSVAFGLAESYEGLIAARFVQGVGGALAWGGGLVWVINASPRERRGAMLGIALAGASAGHLAGPVLGALAATTGRGAGFLVVGALAALLALVAVRFRSPPAVSERVLDFRAALRSGDVRTAIWVITVPAAVFGALLALGPLRLADLGAGPEAIAVAFVVAAAAGMFTRPLTGSWSDRRGRLRPIRFGLLACVPALVALSLVQGETAAIVILVVALLVVNVTLAPSIALLSDVCEASGAGQVVAVAMLNVAWTPGIIAGSAGGGVSVDAIGHASTYVILALVALAMLLLLGRRSIDTSQVSPGQLRPGDASSP